MLGVVAVGKVRQGLIMVHQLDLLLFQARAMEDSQMIVRSAWKEPKRLPIQGLTQD